MTAMDGDDLIPLSRGATALHPLLGLTVLLVEDSRHASEAIRLMCQRSGARLRRADSLTAARRHLRVLRPGAAVVDIGLPDGSGLSFLHELAATQPRIDAIVATSADPESHAAALAAGADVFLPKPIANLATFQAAVLGRVARGVPMQGVVELRPDRSAVALSLRDDLAHAVRLIEGPGAMGKAGYLAQFLGGIAADVGDRALAQIARELGHAAERAQGVAQAPAAGAGSGGGRRLEEMLSRLGRHLEERLGEPAQP
jgi:DNA-binding response OmpR family regulator